jgi:cation diffusion facilitator family transporter
MDTRTKEGQSLGEVQAEAARRAMGAKPDAAAGQTAMDAAQTREAVIVRTSVVGIVANVLLAAFKAIVGFASNSIAVILDAVNNLSDALSSVITIVGAKLAGRAPDEKHPLGYGRIEYLSATVIAAIVLYAGFESLSESVKKIIWPETADYSAVTLLVIAAAVVVKLVLGRFVSAQGAKVHSGSLEASGKDALFDAVLSASVLAAAIIYLVSGVSLEAYVGVVISIVIVKAGIDMLRDSVDDILGNRVDSDRAHEIVDVVKAQDGVLGAFDLLLHSYGPSMTVGSIHIEVPDTMTAEGIDDLTRRIQRAVHERTGVLMGTVGVYARNADPEAVAMREDIVRRAMAHAYVLQVHGFHVDFATHEASFDVVVSFDAPDRRAVFREVCDEIERAYPAFTFNVALDIDSSDISKHAAD